MKNQMVRLGTLILLGFLASATVAEAGDVYVQGYTRQDGTYVAPYHRTTPDNTINNNYSTYPNVNPYTGQQGTRPPEPYQSPYTNPLPRAPYGGF